MDTNMSFTKTAFIFIGIALVLILTAVAVFVYRNPPIEGMWHYEWSIDPDGQGYTSGDRPKS